MKDVKSVVGGLSIVLKTVGAYLLSFSIVLLPVHASSDQLLQSQEEETSIQKPPITPSDREVHCLTKNIYHESRGESYIGQKAVAFVTLNRTISSRFPDSICDVVYQRRGSSCQFHWVCIKNIRVTDHAAYDRAKELALKVLTRYHEIADPSRGALFFHATSTKVAVRSGRTTAVIGQHRFYK